MLIVGLTGGLATGKSMVTAAFARLGAKAIDTDKIVHKEMRRGGRCYASVVRAFGTQVAGKKGIDRRKLGEIVFADKRKLKRLEKIVHPKVRLGINEELKKYRGKGIAIVEVPLLFEAGFDRYVDTTIVVTAQRNMQIDRSAKSLKLTRTEALRRINAQMPLRDKIRRADIIIDNSKTKTQTYKQVKAIWQKLTQRTKK